MLNRRQFLGAIPASAVVIQTTLGEEPRPGGSRFVQAGADGILASPPVVQNPRSTGFGVSIAVNELATAWVEYGFAENDLPFVATASHHGLVHASNRALHIRVHHAEEFPRNAPIFYRVVAQPLAYRNAYQLERGEPQATAIHALRLPHANMEEITVVSINDTHENSQTLKRLHHRIAAINPDLLIWNGDTCNDFNESKSTEQILLNPARGMAPAWATTRPLVFSNGNHDVRGRLARELPDSFASAPESTELPYCQALRFGPLAVLTLDTGEDKPDQHPVFAGTAAYEPYRKRQKNWLQQAIARPDIQSAPFKIVACHIPLRGLDGEPDGTTLDQFAMYSGFGSMLWLPLLKDASVQAILSGHTHHQRVDEPTKECPIHQFVGGGPTPERATVTIVTSRHSTDQSKLEIRVTDLDDNTLHEIHWTA